MQPRKLVWLWVEAFNKADVDALAELYAADAVNHQMPERPMYGRGAIRAMFTTLFTVEFAKAKPVCLVEQVYEDGEWGILEWKDPLGLRGCGFFHVVDGKITMQRGYWDKLSFLRSQGLPLPTE